MQYQLSTGEEAAVQPADLAYFHSTVYTIIGISPREGEVQCLTILIQDAPSLSW